MNELKWPEKEPQYVVDRIRFLESLVQVRLEGTRYEFAGKELMDWVKRGNPWPDGDERNSESHDKEE